MNHPLAKFIPEQPFPSQFRQLSLRTRSDVLFEAYARGFHGCFLQEDAPEWAQRIARYDMHQFFADTPGPGHAKLFSTVYDSLEDTDEAQCVYTQQTFDAWERDGDRTTSPKGPFSIFQDYGICVDSSNVEMKAGLLGVRAMDPAFNEVLRYLPAHYAYAERGYCTHGWTMGACATVNARCGWAPAMEFNLDRQRLDWTSENEHEDMVAEAWCRSGLPSWLENHCKQTYPWEQEAITRFDGREDAIKRCFQNKGQLHHGSTTTSRTSRPANMTRIGGHAQTAFGADWSERTIKFFRDKGIEFSEQNFPILNHQTWGKSWQGAVADQYWPSWWGRKPEGAWICSARQFMQHFAGECFAYLPRLKGVPGDGPAPDPPPEPVSIESRVLNVEAQVVTLTEMVKQLLDRA